MMRLLVFIFVGLLLLASFVMADNFVFGPPAVPDINVTTEEYQSRLDKVIENSKSSDYLYELAYLALQMEDLKKAEDYFKLSLKRDNFSESSYKPNINYWLGEIYEKKGDLFKAQEFYVKHGDIYFIHLVMAKIYRADEMYDLAEQEYLDALELDLFKRCNYEAYPLLIDMYMELEEFKNAKQATKKYIKRLKSFEKENSCDISKAEFQKEIRKAEELLENIKKKK